MKNQLGSEVASFDFNCEALYPNPLDMSILVAPFTENEIRLTVLNLAKNKAFGPDEVPNEFAKFYWNDVKSEIVSIVQEFHIKGVDLSHLNRANIVMIPKIESPVEVNDFWSISIINLIPKIISKLLATRLAQFLPNLVSVNQTVFVQGRQISENFVATCEILHHISKGKWPAVFLKLILLKFLTLLIGIVFIKVLHVRGFSPQWVNWIKHLLEIASPRIVINGKIQIFFYAQKRLETRGSVVSNVIHYCC